MTLKCKGASMYTSYFELLDALVQPLSVDRCFIVKDEVEARIDGERDFIQWKLWRKTVKFGLTISCVLFLRVWRLYVEPMVIKVA